MMGYIRWIVQIGPSMWKRTEVPKSQWCKVRNTLPPSLKEEGGGSTSQGMHTALGAGNVRNQMLSQNFRKESPADNTYFNSMRSISGIWAPILLHCKIVWSQMLVTRAAEIQYMAAVSNTNNSNSQNFTLDGGINFIPGKETHLPSASEDHTVCSPWRLFSCSHYWKCNLEQKL